MDLGYFSLWCQFPAFKIRIVLIVADTPENGVEIVTGGAIDVAPEKGAVLRQTGMLFDMIFLLSRFLDRPGLAAWLIRVPVLSLSQDFIPNLP